MSEPDVGTYRRPDSLSEILTLLDRRPASVLAGGTDLVMMRADGAVDRAHDIVDIKGVPGLRGISLDADGTLVIGAATPLRELAGTTVVPPHAITDGAALVGGWQTRARGTIGGNICRASPAGDTLPGLLAADARLELASTTGTRLVSAHDFFTGPGRTVREPGELLTRIIVPASRGASSYLRFTYRLAMDLAVVGVAAHVEIEHGRCVAARVALGAAAATPVLAPDAADALVGTELDAPSVEAAARLVLDTATPIDDGRGSRAHRRTVLPVLAERAIGIAFERAREGHPR
ncbi:FAD binding domain-containing protein [Streptomyces griseiscabiei]|uniref:FAD binding domain-containing protein n=1 Tax=Streptomyces griseiscabiei TaxID=2993540 RepID=A0ABU4L470_9ACTN|nr:FAD binding domain-containing protein [Streptomyces griseiscabiei]MBZ3901450.1 FAD binding domain-containing protein [Streptomyces griseiscabiei]MDX2909999.1 FAD binding domain-containing protein [Streptomyces griseiscabiei]